MSFWHQLAVGFGLLLVIEGIIPFLSPRRWRHLVIITAQISEQKMRGLGLFSMLLGVAILWLLNQ